MENIIENFIQEMLKKAGIANLPEDFKKEYTEKLSVEVQQRLGMMALAELKENDLKEFEKLITKETEPKSDDLLTFFRERIPDFENKLSETLKKFADEFIQGAERLKGTKLST